VGATGTSQRLNRLGSPVEFLPHELSVLHVGGFLRAVGSALDCLGSTMIGVLALPTSILKGDLGIARRVLNDTPKGTPRQTLHIEFAEFLDEVIKNAGPDGWLEWAFDCSCDALRMTHQGFVGGDGKGDGRRDLP